MRASSSRTRWTVAAAVTLIAVAVVLVPFASATTSPTNYKIFNVRLTDHGVVFKPKAQLEAGEVGLFRITNVSKAARVFVVSVRASHLLKSRGREAFYELFPQQGRVKWMSHARQGKTFTGFLKVVPCKNANGTSSCNGTDG
jgi:hypothetical protein